MAIGRTLEQAMALTEKQVARGLGRASAAEDALFQSGGGRSQSGPADLFSRGAKPPDAIVSGLKLDANHPPEDDR